MENAKKESIITECYYCLGSVEVSLEAKCFTCPHCGEHSKFDAREMYSRLKMIMKKAYGDKPKNPENN